MPGSTLQIVKNKTSIGLAVQADVDLSVFYRSVVNSENASMQYIDSLRSQNSKRSMTSALNQFVKCFGIDDHRHFVWERLTINLIEKVIGELLKQDHLAPSSINVYISAIKGTIKSGLKAGTISHEFYAKTKMIKGASGSRVKRNNAIADKDIIGAVIKVCEKENTLKGYRDALILTLLSAGGLRRDEVCRLTLDDYKQPRGVIFVRGKGNKERPIELQTIAKNRLDAWIDIHRGDSEGPLIPRIHRDGHLVFTYKTENVDRNSQFPKLTGQAIYNVVKKRFAQVLDDEHKVHPHTMRHYFGTTMLRLGNDIVTVRDLLGHASITTTQNYIDKDFEAQRTAMKSVDL